MQTVLFNDIRDDLTHGHNQMFSTEIRLFTFFVAGDGEEKLYTVTAVYCDSESSAPYSKIQA